jgi:hypothetical protein
LVALPAAERLHDHEQHRERGGHCRTDHVHGAAG